MRSFLAALSVAAVLITAQPASAGVERGCDPLTYGLPDSCHTAPVETIDRFQKPGTEPLNVVWWNEPPLPYGSPLTFVDSVIGTIKPAHRADWREARNEALDAWGVPYRIVRTDGLAPFDTAVSEERNGLPGVIRLGQDVSGACQSYGGWWATVGGGVAVVCLPPRWWAVWDIGRALAHEVGHAFGLGHSTTGIMSGGSRVSAEERLAVQGYYA